MSTYGAMPEQPNEYDNIQEEYDRFQLEPKRRITAKERIKEQFKLNALVAEFIGTFSLTLTLGLVVPQIQANGRNIKMPILPLSVVMVLSTNIEMFRDISGSHFNPAVTFGNLLRGSIGLVNSFFYVVAQLLGGTAGVAVADRIIRRTFNYNYDFFVVLPNSNAPTSVILGGEFIFSFLLVLGMLYVTSHKESENRNSLVGISVASVVGAGIFAVGGVTGACFNPAVATGSAIVNTLYHVKSVIDWNPMSALFYYWIGPMAGGFVAAIVYFIIAPSEFKRFYQEWHPIKLLL
mmetsp:Transcript_1201/g.1829  ORF Transcript_1201/g.1829 Transcript_1201/m.1829 type:complete len:292 (+) Transcript_1201:24-899(+)